MFYEYGNDEKEFVFVSKGRPFPCLVSPFLPTPTASLLDYNLVRELGLKMTDIQCQKFSYAGFKMRILGKVSATVQCVHDGVSSGAFHIKANVVLDLGKNLDAECVAGSKMEAQLMGGGPSAPASPTTTAPSPAPSVPAARTPPRTPPTPSPPCSPAPRSPPPSPRSPRSPPGFPPRPQYAASPGDSISDPRIPVFRVYPDGRAMSPGTANARALTIAFKDADLKPTVEEETLALGRADPDGDFTDDEDGNINCYFTNGLMYQYGHGRDKCSRIKCNYAVKEKPNNCGYNKMWRLPDNFSPCDDYCQGAFCRCLYNYPNPGSKEIKKKGKKKK